MEVEQAEQDVQHNLNVVDGKLDQKCWVAVQPGDDSSNHTFYKISMAKREGFDPVLMDTYTGGSKPELFLFTAVVDNCNLYAAGVEKIEWIANILVIRRIENKLS